MKKTLFFLLAFQLTFAQTTKRVLFIGNSYTHVNDLPQLCASMASCTGNALIHDNSTPGGFTLDNHCYNQNTLFKIQSGNWDFVVLQEQSQLPAFPSHILPTAVFTFATTLNNRILQYNPCAETVFYMTWGRKNGDSQLCPDVPETCTYEGMDDRLHQSYMTMANDNSAIVSPVGAVWRYLRQNHPELELYAADESHPSLLGSYAAACTFYTTIFRNDPTLINYNATLSAIETTLIKDAVKAVVYDHLSDWNIGNYDPQATYTFSTTGFLDYQFTNTSVNAQSYLWDFGDGTSSTDTNPNHTFASPGSYAVNLTATSSCGQISTLQLTVDAVLERTDWKKSDVAVYPNPTSGLLFVDTEHPSVNVKLFNTLGQLLKESDLKSKTAVDLANLADGVYFIQIKTETGAFTKRVIKK